MTLIIVVGSARQIVQECLMHLARGAKPGVIVVEDTARASRDFSEVLEKMKSIPLPMPDLSLIAEKSFLLKNKIRHAPIRKKICQADLCRIRRQEIKTSRKIWRWPQSK